MKINGYGVKFMMYILNLPVESGMKHSLVRER